VDSRQVSTGLLGNAGFRNRSLDAAKVIFRAPLDSFHVDPEPRFVAQLLSEIRCAATGYFDVSEVTRLAAKAFVKCGPTRCLDSPWKWPHCGRRHPALATTNSWAAAWQICLSGPPPNIFANERIVPSRPRIIQLCRICFPISSSPGHPFLCQASPSPFGMYLRAFFLRPSAHKCGLVRCNA